MASATGGLTDLNALRSLLLPHIKMITGAKYQKKDQIYDKIFSLSKTNMFYDEMTEVAPLSLFQEVGEGEKALTDSIRQNFKTKATQVDYALAHQITHKALRFANPKDVALESSKHIADAAFHSMETLATLILDRSRNSSYVGGDGKELIATDHPLIDEASASNELATAATLSQESVQDLDILMKQMVDPRGNPMGMRPKHLIVNVGNSYKAQEILQTEYQVDTANNTRNILVSNRILPGGCIELNYSSDANAHYLLADASAVNNAGLCCKQSADLEIESDVDVASRTMNIHGFFSTVFFWHDFRQIVGTAGA